ncbi:YceK/YidQ family lipoprotein [Salinisphaera sp. C84B14]|uniref:YceK/YidQ family lipoprotein n=1 Tax=Salinisphaera sp. C84B14 TaxID=1304155 RepID=UPI00333EA321
MNRNFALVLITCALAPGCGTMMSKNAELWEQDCAQDERVSLPRVYSGTALDLYAVGKDLPRGGQIGAFLFWDIPFSLVADTVILPYTLYGQIWHGNHTCQVRGEEKAIDA